MRSRRLTEPVPAPSPGALPNPLLRPWSGEHEAPDFGAIRVEHFLPAFEVTIAENRAEIEAIAANMAPADFDNVIAALERSGAALARVRRLFWMLASAEADAPIRAIESEVSALLTRHGTEISHDRRLFERIAEVWRTRDRLNPEQSRLTDNSYKGFVSGGAALEAKDKQRFAAIDQKLAELSVAFGQNVLGATNGWEMLLGKDELGGIPADLIDAAARRAAERGIAERYCFTLDRSDFEGLLSFAERREIRERVWRAFTSRCDGGAHDNNRIVAEIVALRDERARLLGYASYADYKLEDSMAKTPATAEALMLRVWRPALGQAKREAEALQELIDRDGGGFALEAWDWRYYAERIRRERYDYDAAAVRQYLTLDKVRIAAFDAARRLYGLHFERRPELPVYHPQVDAWAVSDEQGARAGLIYTDYLARPQKHGGAWMGSLRVQEKLDRPVLPIVYTVANFTTATTSGDSLLSLDEARTLFHEFGHALHALLSDVTYPSLAGTAVARDFVEFPSKLMEHWVVAPEALAGFGVPRELAEAIDRADSFGQGFATVEFLASALVDLALHRAPPAALDPARFEAETLGALGMPQAIAMRHRLAYFTHVFDGGYASAYYSYLWSEVLDADVFEAFEQSGDMFEPALARRLRDEVLAPGDSRDPLDSFIAFRGRPPDESALLRSRSLVEALTD